MVGCGLSLQLWRLWLLWWESQGRPSPRQQNPSPQVWMWLVLGPKLSSGLIRKESCEFLAEASPELQGVQGNNDLHPILEGAKTHTINNAKDPLSMCMCVHICVHSRGLRRSHPGKVPHRNPTVTI